jgi:hypothetical protein
MATTLLLKAALIQVSDYMHLGASGAINLNQPSIVYKIFNIGKEPGWLNESGSWIT